VPIGKDTLKTAKKAIQQYFANSTRSVYKETDLYALLRTERLRWRIAPSTGGSRFVDFLVSSGILREVKLESESYASKRRFAREKTTPYEVALSLAVGGYLSHGTAVFLHGLNEQIPKTIYVNREQRPKATPEGGLIQKRLDLAFAGRQRTSKYVFKFGSERVVLLNGKHTGRFEVEEIEGPSGEHLVVTSVGRTLVDIAVRPGYAGGISQVLEAYMGARGNVSGEKILNILKSLDYMYPYHQSIGFLLERAGYPERDVAPFRIPRIEFDFYLLHGMREREYDEKWRLFYPKGF
jgi:predicted transcriptional regulator of viral defense system